MSANDSRTKANPRVHTSVRCRCSCGDSSAHGHDGEGEESEDVLGVHFAGRVLRRFWLLFFFWDGLVESDGGKMPRVFDAVEMLSMEGTDGHDMDKNDGRQEGVCSCLIY